ncbi:hypothetical protein QMP26_22115 [Enterocloster clostridioformis]
MNQSSGNKPVIHVRMFGGFIITMDEKAMSDSDNRSSKLSDNQAQGGCEY